LLATRQTILTSQDVANKSATSWQQGMEFGKRHDRHNGLLPGPTCYRLNANLLKGNVRGTGFWPTQQPGTFQHIDFDASVDEPLQASVQLN